MASLFSLLGDLLSAKSAGNYSTRGATFSHTCLLPGDFNHSPPVTLRPVVLSEGFYHMDPKWLWALQLTFALSSLWGLAVVTHLPWTESRLTLYALLWHSDLYTSEEFAFTGLWNGLAWTRGILLSDCPYISHLNNHVENSTYCWEKNRVKVFTQLHLSQCGTWTLCVPGQTQ